MRCLGFSLRLHLRFSCCSQFCLAACFRGCLRVCFRFRVGRRFFLFFLDALCGLAPYRQCAGVFRKLDRLASRRDYLILAGVLSQCVFGHLQAGLRFRKNFRSVLLGSP